MSHLESQAQDIRMAFTPVLGGDWRLCPGCGGLVLGFHPCRQAEEFLRELERMEAEGGAVQ